jgi:predicted NAD/FAD-binding protein
MKIAIIGAGVAGLVAGYHLAPYHEAMCTKKAAT